jgi:predicted phage tail protein
MSNDLLKILISAKLDENLSQRTIQDQLNKIQNKLNLTIGIDVKQINQIANQVKQLQAQFEKQSKGVRIVNDEETLKNLNQIKKGIPEIYTSIDKALEKYKQFGQVKIEQIFDPVTKELTAFNLQLEKAQGVVEKIKFDLIKLQMPDGNIQNAFQVANRKIIDDTEKLREKHLQIEQKVDAQMQKQNEKLQHQLDIFKRQAEINVKNLQRRYGDAVDNKALKNYLENVRSLSVETPNLKRKMDELNITFKEISANVRSASSYVLSFGEAFKTAMVKFCRLV